MRRKAYLAGPVRGIPLYNFPAFDAARDRLIDRGRDVISPADLDRAVGLDPADLPPDHDWSLWGEASPNSTIKRDVNGRGRHTTKMAWRGLAKLELELEAALAKS